MKYRQLDANGDYQFGHGLQNFVTKREAVAQAIKTRLWLLYGEWWEDQEDGLPLFERILASSGSDRNREVVDAIIRDRIEGTEGVINVISYESDYRDRIYTFTALVNTLYGEVTVTNEEAS